MPWQSNPKLSKEKWFSNYVDTVLSTSYPEPPPKTHKIGNTAVSWFESEPGVAVILSKGGNFNERSFAEWIVKQQVEAAGYKRAQFTFDHDFNQRTADWDEIEQKAQRLIDSGNVQVIRNGYNNIVGHVIGDHGEYDTEIGRDDPNSRAITTWQCECNNPHNLVVMADGSTKEVQYVQTGDKVLTATGYVGIVGRTMNRDYDGRMIGLKIEGSTEKIWLTDNHKLVTTDFMPKEAGDWKTGDYSYMPQPQFVSQDYINVDEFVSGLVEYEDKLYLPNKGYGSTRQRKGTWTTNPYSTRQKPIPARIPLDENFARIAGLFVAEGIATPRGELRWSFSQDEQHLADEIIERLKVYGLDNAKKKNARSCTTVAIQSKPFSELFRSLFGTGSRTKKLAMPIMAMNKEALQIFFDAWVEGDGCTSRPYRNYLGTASDTLAMQARLILAILEKESVVRRIENNVSELVPNGGSFNQIVWRKNGGKGQGARWFENEQVNQRMIVEEEHYVGKVYNFEVLGEHSYVLAPGIASFNCPWDQYAWQRTRKWKPLEGRPCAHVLALYWQAQSMPLDEDQDQGQQQLFDTGQGGPSSPGIPRGPALAPQGQQLQIPGIDPGQAQGTAPMPPGAVPGQPAPDMLPPFPQAPKPPPPVSIPGGKLPSPLNPLQYPGGTFSSWKLAQFDESWNLAKLADVDNILFDQSQWGMLQVRTNKSHYGIMGGKSEEHGAGQYKEIPQNSIGTLMEAIEDMGGQASVVFAGPQAQAGPMEPEHVQAWIPISDLSPMMGVRPPGQWGPRRRASSVADSWAL